MTVKASFRIVSLLLAGLVVSASSAHAQYFGRNKVQYRTFQFRVLATEHFDVYYYPAEEPAARMIGRMAERWLARLSQFFDHQLRGRQSVILYASTEDFRQTNAVEGLIGEGTGGVTESLKRRIIVPMAGSIADTDHVLGHELVHAFQFDMTGVDPHMADRAAPGILAYPLWFVEGMAEYVSIGPVDAQTAMWLRDAAVTGRLPSLKDLDNPKFFPYRWGQAFWAYVGARWGDRQIASLLRSAANPRFDLGGMAAQLGTDPETLAKDWHQAIRDAEQVVERDRSSIGSQPRRVLAESSGAGRINIGPRLSPDGRQIAFFSERDKFSIDLYLADAETGRIERKLLRTAQDPHFDSLQFLSSAGAWSPDGKTIALAVARNGQPAIALLDARSGDIQREIPLAGLSDALNPAWAPDGQSIVFSGNSGGFTDLFRVTPRTGALERLTDDPYADLEPAFTPDGRAIVFVTERFSTSLATLEPGPLRLARLDLATHEIVPIAAFLTGKHLSPQVSADGRVLTFIAEPDGVSNLYRMPIDGGPIEQLSSVLTGIAGITASSPALSMAAGTGRLAFSQFERDGDAIYILDPANIVATVAPASSTRAAVLPPRAKADGTVYGLISNAGGGLPAPDRASPSAAYRSKLKLDLVGQPTVSAGYNEWGSVVAGSVSAQFSDMLGDRVLGLGAEVSGTLDDLGGQMIFVNRRHRWNFGVEVEQTPYRVDFLTITSDPVANLDTVVQSILRLTSRGTFGLAQYPISPIERIEFTGGARRLTLIQEDRTETFEDSTGTFLSRTDVKTPLGRPLNLAQAGMAFVHDTSFFGATSPIYGRRYRLEVDRSTGTLHYTSVLTDVREYVMPRRPITIAFRALHFGRYGRDADDVAQAPLFLGYPEIVHGYGFGSFQASECAPGPSGTCEVLDRLIGSRLLVGNIEVRAPLVGLFRRDITYGRVPVEVAAFYDAGVAWTGTSRPTFAGGDRIVVRSAGGAIRINVFGVLVVELSASHPFDRGNRSLQWQLGIRQGF